MCVGRKGGDVYVCGGKGKGETCVCVCVRMKTRRVFPSATVSVITRLLVLSPVSSFEPLSRPASRYPSIFSFTCPGEGRLGWGCSRRIMSASRKPHSNFPSMSALVICQVFPLVTFVSHSRSSARSLPLPNASTLLSHRHYQTVCIWRPAPLSFALPHLSLGSLQLRPLFVSGRVIRDVDLILCIRSS